MQGQDEMLLFRPYDSNSPVIKALENNTNWRWVYKSKEVLQAYPTSENYNFLLDYGLEFEPTSKVWNWHEHDIDPDKEYQLKVWDEKHLTLFDYQREGARFLTRHDRAMLSLSPGLGKTLTSAYAAGIKDFDRVMVVCPASLLFYWKGELEKWYDKLPRKPFVSILHRGKLQSNAHLFPEADQHWLITNPETVVKYLDSIDNGGDEQRTECLIIDESIMYKHRDSGRSKAIKALAKEIPVTWLLTGAPATRYLDDMWHQFHILKPQGYPSYWRFARTYCSVIDDEWGSKVVSNAFGAEKKIKENYNDIYFSRTQDDVANIPDWIMEDIDIPMLPAQDKAYETLRKDFYVKLESIDPNEVITVNNHLSLMIRSIQLASNPLLVGGVDSAGKWDALPELMQIYPGPYIIWVNFIQTGLMIRDILSTKAYTVNQLSGKKTSSKFMRVALANGSTSMEDRNQMVDTFQKGELDVLILNNQVGKFGFTLTRARTAFFVERGYDDSYFQCLHRNRRIGTTESPVIVNMRSVTADGRETIDHLIHSTLDYRVGMIKKVTAGDLKKVFTK